MSLIFPVKTPSGFKEATITDHCNEFILSNIVKTNGYVQMSNNPIDLKKVEVLIPGYPPLDSEERGYPNPDFRLNQHDNVTDVVFKATGLTTLLPPDDSKMFVIYQSIELGVDVITDPNVIASAVWDKLSADHNTDNTFGALLNNLKNDSDFADFQGYVFLDELNGINGVSHPIGTVSSPSNNISDSLSIASRFNLKNIISTNVSCILTNTLSLDNFLLTGRMLENNNIQFNGGTTNNLNIVQFTISGIQNGPITATNCIIDGLQDIHGFYQNCILDNTIKIKDESPVYLVDCYSRSCSFPVLDLDGINQDVIIRGYSGYIKIINKTSTNSLCIDMTSGTVEVDPTCLGKNILIRGSSQVIDESNLATVTTISSDIDNLETIFTDGILDVKGLLNENTINIATYENGFIKSMRQVQYTDKTLTNVRKVWVRDVLDSEGRRVKQTSKKEE